MNNRTALTAEVGKIIRNTLIRYRAVTLPEVGCLRVELRRAHRDGRRLYPSWQRVAFRPEGTGVDLVAAIAAEIGGDTVRAGEVYARWLTLSRTDERLTIEGVGRLHNGHFRPTEEFDALLNPLGRSTIRLHRRRHWWRLLAAAMLCLVLGLGAAVWFGLLSGVDLSGLYADRSAEPMVVAEVSVPAPTAAAESSAQADAASDRAVPAVEPEAAATPAPEPATAAEPIAKTAPAAEPATAAAPPTTPPTTPATTPAAQPAPAAPASASQPAQPATQATTPPAASSAAAATASAAPAGTEEEIWAMVSQRNYVIYGVFSNPDNSRRAAAALRKEGMTPQIYIFGSKWMVALAEAASADECREYIRAHRDRYPDLWTYTAR